MQRSNTTSQTTFNLLNSDGEPAVIFDFEHGDTFRVIIPSSSKWKYWHHWESPGSPLCNTINVLEGRILISVAYAPPVKSGAILGGKGTKRSFEPNTRWSWCSNNKWSKEPVDLVVNLTGDQAFHRNVCSAILDRERMASLASTPIILRCLLSFLAIVAPSLRKWVLDKMLAIQLRMIFYHHGFWIIHWTIPILFWWQWRQILGEPRPPEWAYRLFWRMQKGTTYAVQGLCYWVGRLLLGMKGRYPEYTPDPSG